MNTIDYQCFAERLDDWAMNGIFLEHNKEQIWWLLGLCLESKPVFSEKEMNAREFNQIIHVIWRYIAFDLLAYYSPQLSRAPPKVFPPAAQMKAFTKKDTTKVISDVSMTSGDTDLSMCCPQVFSDTGLGDWPAAVQAAMGVETRSNTTPLEELQLQTASMDLAISTANEDALMSHSVVRTKLSRTQILMGNFEAAATYLSVLMGVSGSFSRHLIPLLTVDPGIPNGRCNHGVSPFVISLYFFSFSFFGVGPYEKPYADA